VADSIKRSLRVLTAATVVLYIVVGGLSIWTYRDSHSNRDALCALRADLQARIQTSTTFLVEHPEGVAGIPAKTIRDGIINQQRTVNALSGLSCGEQPAS
jgi:hypothetical protein